MIRDCERHCYYGSTRNCDSTALISLEAHAAAPHGTPAPAPAVTPTASSPGGSPRVARSATLSSRAARQPALDEEEVWPVILSGQLMVQYDGSWVGSWNDRMCPVSVHDIHL